MNAPRSYQRCYRCGAIDTTTAAVELPVESTPHAVSRWRGLLRLFMSYRSPKNQ